MRAVPDGDTAAAALGQLADLAIGAANVAAGYRGADSDTSLADLFRDVESGGDV